MKNNNQVKVIFLTKYPEKGASSRYRVYQYLPYFNTINFKTQALLSDTSYKLMYRKGQFLKKVIVVIRDYLSRSFFVLKNLDADVIYMQREVFAFGPLWAESLFKLLGKTLIFDLDDALFINKTNKNNPFKWDKASRVKRIISKVDLVIAGNTWIRDQCKKLGAKEAIHIDVAENVQFEDLKRKTNTPLKAIWLGSPTTSEYLYSIEKPLKEMQDNFGLEIIIIGSDSNDNFSFVFERVNWSIENEQKYLSISDVGLIPLPILDNWSKGKCGGKARTYMASGVIPIVSDIGYNRGLIEHKKSGFLCASQEDWYESLKFINNNVELQEQIRKLNYRNVYLNFDRKKIAKIIEDTIINLKDPLQKVE